MEADFICRLEENFFRVNSALDVTKYSPTIEELTFHIMTPDKDKKLELKNPRGLTADEVLDEWEKGQEPDDTTFFYVSLPCGNDEGSFIDTEALKRIRFVLSEGWTQSRWNFLVDDLYFSALCYNPKAVHVDSNEEVAVQGVDLDKAYFESISFRMVDIESYAKIGISTIYLTLKNSDQTKIAEKKFYVHKKPSELQIMDFSPENHCVKRGQNAKLHWKAGAFQKGKILPVDFYVDKNEMEYNSTIYKSTEFELCIENDNQSVKRKTFVYILPPKIKRFEYVNGRLFWDTAFAEKVFVNGSSAVEKGDIAFSSSQEEAVIFCDGYFYGIRRSICVRKDLNNLFIEKTELSFANYVIVRIKWNAQEALAFQLNAKVELTEVISNKKEGFYEYPFPKNSNPRFTVTLQKQDRNYVFIELDRR